MSTSEDDLAVEYNEAENEFFYAFRQMNYWKEEADRRNKVAGTLCQRLIDVKDKEKAKEEHAQP